MAHDTITIATSYLNAYDHTQGYSMVEEVAVDTTGIRTCAGFIPSTTGIAAVTPAGSGSEVELPVTAGTLYPISIQAFNASNSTAGQKLYLLRQRNA